jgi:hypothetical protein
MSFRKILLALLLLGILSPTPIFAAELDVTPVVIDDKAKARDILKRSITIQNTSNRKLELYPSVNNVRPADGTEAFVSAQGSEDRADSLANWIELSRGVVEINPGEEKTIQFIVRVAPNAIPGVYHASITLGTGSDRASAESRAPLATVTINVEVGEDVKEFMQLNKFTTDKLFFSGDDVLFNYNLENIGNQELLPKGEIRIYNRKGEEVASVEVNPESKKFSPDQMLQLASAWNAATGFGKYKAYLNVDYGSNQVASVQDTVYFWIVPWQQLLALIIAALVAVVALAIYYHRWLEDQHRVKFGLAPAHVEAVLGAGEESMHTRPGIASRALEFSIEIVSVIVSAAGSVIPKRRSRPVVTEDHVDTESQTPRRSFREEMPVTRTERNPAALERSAMMENSSGVIDLKKMRPKSVDQSHAYTEVINLKKRP